KVCACPPFIFHLLSEYIPTMLVPNIGPVQFDCSEVHMVPSPRTFHGVTVCPEANENVKLEFMRATLLWRICGVVCALWLVGFVRMSPAAAQSYSQTVPWNYSVGNSSSFSAYVNGQLSLTGDVTGTSALAQSAAGGSILGISKEIV